MADGQGAKFHMTGNFGPVDDEATLLNLEVHGAVPPELSGVYMRNGGNPRNGDTEHFFFGDGMLNGVRLGGGKAQWFKNRWVRTACYEGKLRTDMAHFGDFRVTSANTNIVRHGGKFFALEEGAFPYEVDVDMNSIGINDFGGKLKTAFTAHPKICPETGEMHGFGYSPMPPWLTYHRFDAAGRLVESQEIPVKGPTMIHDFGMTRNHVVFMDLPVVFDLEMAIAGKMPFRWSDDYGARLGIMARGGKAEDIRWVDVAPCYVFHPGNAYEENGELVMTVCRFEKLWVGQSYDFEYPPQMHEWRINLTTLAVRETAIDDAHCEFPRVDDRRAGLVTRYNYVAGAETSGATEFNLLLKYDLKTGARSSLAFPNMGLSEFVFAPGGPGEDEGWLVGFAYDKTRNGSDFIVVDAQGMNEVARIRLPRRVPFGFHGNWFEGA
ncbi:MAG: 9-cis-epoxycarotenoid dioxygenase [Alphaproteobacteria bacterium]|nr:9-cis-epoxycarotenoid dioxygenase [Alphaproteobacteria bacterium]